MTLYCSPALKAFSCELSVAFAHLDAIESANMKYRNESIENQQILHHGSDNCQQWHPFSTQRANATGVMHTGMAYNIVLAREYSKPKGTLLKDKDGACWRVLSSSMPTFWTCKMKLQRADSITDEKTVVLPDTDWSIASIPETPPRPALTYLNQAFRPSIRMKVPMSIGDLSLLCSN